MKTPLLAVVLALPLWLGGCAVARPPTVAEAPLPTSWQAPLPHGGAVADLSRWWQLLGDPLLAQLIDAAQSASPTLASARARIEQARATRTATQAALLPTLDGTAAASRGNSQSPLPLATTVQAGLQTAWEIDLFGGNRAAAEAAEARLRAAEAGWHDARVLVAVETANSYVDLRTCRALLAVAENDARSRSETSRLSQLSADAGFTAPASAALARASAADAAGRVRQQRARCEVEIKTLAALTARDESSLRQELAVARPTPALDSLLSVSSLPAEVLRQRPDLYQAELDVAAASADVGTAQASRYPRLSLSGSIAVGRVHIGGDGSGAQTWSIGPLALSVPLFDGGRRAANAEAAQARYEESVALYSARTRQAVREVEQALVMLESTQARDQDARTAVEGYRASFTATQARYDGGLASLVELEDARRTLLAAETELVALQRERAASWVALYRAAGGGWRRDAIPLATSRP